MTKNEKIYLLLGNVQATIQAICDESQKESSPELYGMIRTFRDRFNEGLHDIKTYDQQPGDLKWT